MEGMGDEYILHKDIHTVAERHNLYQTVTKKAKKKFLLFILPHFLLYCSIIHFFKIKVSEQFWIYRKIIKIV